MQLKTALGFVELFVPVYREYLADETLDVSNLREQLAGRARELQLELPPEWLAKLAVPRAEFKRSRFHKQGVVETTRFLMGKLFRFSGSLLSHEKDALRRDADLLGTAFGRAPSRGMAAAYARQVLEWVPAEDSPERVTWLFTKMVDDQRRASLSALGAMIEAATNRTDAAAPAIHPVARDEGSRALNNGLDDGRWPSEIPRDGLEAFVATELAVWDGRIAPALADRDPPTEPDRANNKRARRAPKSADAKAAASARVRGAPGSVRSREQDRRRRRRSVHGSGGGPERPTLGSWASRGRRGPRGRGHVEARGAATDARGEHERPGHRRSVRERRASETRSRPARLKRVDGDRDGRRAAAQEGGAVTRVTRVGWRGEERTKMNAKKLILGVVGLLVVACGSSSSGGGAEGTCGPGTALQNGQCIPVQTCGAGTVSVNGACVPAGMGGAAGAGGSSATGGGGPGGSGGGSAGAATGGTGGSSGPGGTGGSGPTQSYVKATIDGKPFVWSQVPSAMPDTFGSTSVVSVQAAPSGSTSILIAFPPEVGTYGGAQAGMLFETVDTTGKATMWQAGNSVGSSTFTVSEVTPRFKGMFSGVAGGIVNSATSIVITAGEFDVAP
jgi:hypothetical protein